MERMLAMRITRHLAGQLYGVSQPLLASGAELDRGFGEWSGGKRRKH
jgi:hypothetical protein